MKIRMNNRNTNESPVSALIIGIFSICFGVFWTIIAGSLFWPMAIFGILWTAVAAVSAVNTYKNIKNGKSEPAQAPNKPEPFEEIRCPYCGAPVHKEDKECGYCDSRL